VATVIKKINRNAFNEKLLHRYLLETYYRGNKRTREPLLPERHHTERINLIVPEKHATGESYRADLTIYFKTRPRGIPVEVKWTSEELAKNSSSHQVEYLSRRGGFAVVVGDCGEKPEKKRIHGKLIHVQKIDPDDFQRWVAANISKLARECLLVRHNSAVENDNQYWIVFLRGPARASFDKMLAKIGGRKTHFWAFKQNQVALRHILDMQKNDRCLFILGSVLERQRLTYERQRTLTVDSWYLTRIKEPYYMVLGRGQGTFFEKRTNASLSKRQWPHFMDFEIEDRFKPDSPFLFGKRGDLASVLAQSVNYGGGSPAPVSRILWETCTDKLRLLRDAINA
jgi:hypothetical protein